MIYKQFNIVCEIMDSLYNWLIINAEKDIDELKLNDCQHLEYEYEKIIKGLLKESGAIKNNNRFEQFNVDSIRRLKIIIDCIKEEYEVINNTKEKDIVYFNSLIGWYEDIPLEMKMFIDSLLNKQL